MKVQEALKAAIETIENYGEFLSAVGVLIDTHKSTKTVELCKSALSDIEKREPVAEALHERNRLGYAVVDVIGTLDEIIENTQEVEIDDFLHIAVPIDMWNELQAALEDMPKRAELYTSPQPIDKCAPVAWLRFYSYQNDMDYDEGFEIVDKYKDGAFPVYTSPISKEWFGLSDTAWMNIVNHDHAYESFTKEEAVHYAVKATEAKLKQLNVEKG